jgi:2',3'-cyclic-nucleotide 2'-phosphodiesterase (5'-nucleotidase family)
MKKRIMLALFTSIVVLAALSLVAATKKPPTTDDAVAAITQFENDAVKADLAGDQSFFEKNYAENWTGGFSGGTWTTKQSMLADMKDTANNKMNSEEISDLKVRVYDNTAIATYTDTYDALIRGEHRAKTVLSTDTFVRQDGVWKEVAGHSSVAAK